uniref:mRNA cap guanine-N(7) methyltransferase n=1 Tax=Dendroctonus ponderosae TaxID=77166 RepID=J3JX37_DENPD|nr:unknown [Dendroctonus ponderosae]
MSENTDDLEQSVMLAAAAADLREYEEAESRLPELKHDPVPVETSRKSYYTETRFSDQERDNNVCTVTNRKETNADSHCRGQARQSTSNKRSREDSDDSDSHPHKKAALIKEVSIGTSHAEVVATHYNLIEEKGLQERSKSRVIHLRNFHNWIKSMLINEYLTKIRDSKKQHNPPIRVHDMCCGKGGDLSKWRIGNISHLICSDIAEMALEDCKNRYASYVKQRSRNDRGWGSNNIFSMEVVHGDGGKVRYREKFKDPSIKLDLVSCQFAFHYSFESLPQANCWFKNVSECLQAGGYFIGTMVDSNEIIARYRKSETDSFGNNVFEVRELNFDAAKPPLFGGKYNFELFGIINCPEFLVHFPTFEKLGKKYGLKLVKKEKFWNFFERMKDEGKQLLTNMGALESYPPTEGKTLVGNDGDDYTHAKEFLKNQNGDDGCCGTLSKSEWEASSLYLTFAFQKVKNTWNADGTPCYDI